MQLDCCYPPGIKKQNKNNPTNLSPSSLSGCNVTDFSDFITGATNNPKPKDLFLLMANKKWQVLPFKKLKSANAFKFLLTKQLKQSFNDQISWESFCFWSTSQLHD